MSTITPHLVQSMVRDWLTTPVNGYLGSSYGQDLRRVLHSPLGANLADAQLEKLRTDVPVLTMLPESSVNLYSDSNGIETKRLYIELAGKLLAFEG